VFARGNNAIPTKQHGRKLTDNKTWKSTGALTTLVKGVKLGQKTVEKERTFGITLNKNEICGDLKRVENSLTGQSGMARDPRGT